MSNRHGHGSGDELLRELRLLETLVARMACSSQPTEPTIRSLAMNFSANSFAVSASTTQYRS